MKEYYKITEVARLYGLCTDTLRYYEEQGLLHPHRSEAGYRLYSIDDICNLNVIRALRELDMPVEHMRRYFEGRTVASTLDMLDEQDAAIRARIAALRDARAAVDARRARLERYDGQEPGLLRLLELPDEIRVLVQTGALEMGHARALLPLATPMAISLARQAAEQGWSVREVEHRVQQLSSGKVSTAPKKGAPKAKAPQADIVALERELSESLGSKVNVVNGRGNKGRLVIHYANLDALEGVLERLRTKS